MKTHHIKVYATDGYDLSKLIADMRDAFVQCPVDKEVDGEYIERIDAYPTDHIVAVYGPNRIEFNVTCHIAQRLVIRALRDTGWTVYEIGERPPQRGGASAS